MALIPKIEICIKNKCATVDITESTGVYNASTNVGGWNAPNITTADVTLAVVQIFDSTGVTLLQTFTIKDTSVPVDLYPTIVGPFTAFADEAWSQPDGIYKIVYSVTDNIGPDTYTNDTQFQLFTCNARNCIDGLVNQLITECDSIKIEELKQKIDQMEIILYGIKSAFSCGNFTKAIDNLTVLNKMCAIFTDCNCGGTCSDC